MTPEPRIVCAGCHKLMPDYGGGHKRCATCSYGARFSASAAGARAALEAHGKRKRIAVVRDDVLKSPA